MDTMTTMTSTPATAAACTTTDAVRYGSTTAHAVRLGRVQGRTVSAADLVIREREGAGADAVVAFTAAPAMGHLRLEGPPV